MIARSVPTGGHRPKPQNQRIPAGPVPTPGARARRVPGVRQSHGPQKCGEPPEAPAGPTPSAASSSNGKGAPAGANRNIREALEESERQQILAALQKANWVVAGPEGAAALLGMNRSTLQSRMLKLGIRVGRTLS
jgi:transcriptional regulator with GAF, ATPase, and Fis domain